MAEKPVKTDYFYDNRGNLIREETEGALIHGYEYGAMNRLGRSWNDKGQEALYLYNGLGQRTGRNVDGSVEDYLLDLTRGYHNLIGIQKGESKQHFYFDGRVTAMEESGRGKNLAGRTAVSGLHYYLQDELGSPTRVSGFCRQVVPFAGRSDYLTYGYDEFGNDLAKGQDGMAVQGAYEKQGDEQLFGFTGYRYDEVSETYFAQAREYQPEYGRFVAKDVLKGDMTALATLNQYGYCWGNPLAYVDKNGMQPEEDKDESMEWMENRGHSYWYTPQGLHEGNVALSLDSEKLRMSEQGKEVLKGFELDVEAGWNENIVVKDKVTNEVVAVYPYYVGMAALRLAMGII